MKFSRLEKVTLCLTAATLCFLAGWFFCAQHEVSRRFVPVVQAPVQSVSPSPSAPPEETRKVNINTAPVEELMNLPGIGEKRAADIAAYREANGPFSIPEAITDVPGIGESILIQIIDFITVEE